MNTYETVKTTNSVNGAILDSMKTPVKFKYRSLLIDAPEGLMYSSEPDANGNFNLMTSVDKELESIKVNIVKNNGAENVVITGIPTKLEKKLAISLVKIPLN